MAPSTILEGQGDFGSPPAIVVIHGHHIIDSNTTVEITPVSGVAQIALGTPVIASNGNWIAVPVTAHVDAALGKGATVALDVKVTQTLPDASGTVTSTVHDKLALVGLKELGNTTTPEVTGTSIDTTKLETRYSKVTLSGAMKFVGARRAIVRSVSSITTGALTANGSDGGTGSVPGEAGGCAGGGPSSSGGCGAIGGEAGRAGDVILTAGGGGGGGFATDGDVGTGNGHGAGGSQTGDDQIVTYDGAAGRTQNRAGGGGGGGTAAGLASGGGGGASGGSIELTAGGNVSVGAISANGGSGHSVGLVTGGGGGAGGLVMVRAAGSLATGTISVKGGSHGTGGLGDGGNGANGRVRWDAAGGSAPAVSDAGSVHRGPAFTVATPVFRMPAAEITLVGTPNDNMNVYAINGEMTRGGPRISIGTGGTVKFVMALQQGLTHLCVTLDGGQQGADEADKCVDVAFLP